jgi:PRTRC genetic system protein C
MATITVEKMKRRFTFNGVSLPDPGEEFTPDEVRDVYAAQYPDISTAVIEGPFQHPESIDYRFVRNVGTKG